MGLIKNDDILAALLLHSMSENFPHLQDAVQNMSHMANFLSEMILLRVYLEDALIYRHQDLGITNPTPSFSLPSQSAFAAQNRPSLQKIICVHCKHPGHSADYCIAPGGKMAGRSIDEARAAWHATLPKLSFPPHSSFSSFSSANVATSSSTATTSSSSSSVTNIPIIINGIQYLPDPSWASASSNTSPTAFISEVKDPLDYPYHACLAISSPSSYLPLPTTLSATLSDSSSASDSPFIVDSGATCHISPNASDFVSL